jgi:hypothetical protein
LACLPVQPASQGIKADGTPCVLNNKCNTYACKNGTCTRNSTVTCRSPPAKGQCHITRGVCNASTGRCTYTKKKDQTPCYPDRRIACRSYACLDGICKASQLPNNTPCTVHYQQQQVHHGSLLSARHLPGRALYTVQCC